MRTVVMFTHLMFPHAVLHNGKLIVTFGETVSS